MDKDDKKEQLVRDYKETFGTEGGKRVLENLKTLSHYNVSFFPHANDGHTDIFEVCREDGKRAVIVHITRMMKKDPYEKKGIING